MSNKATQGRTVIEALKRNALTYRQMLNLGAGNSPWKRCAEALDEEKWQIQKGKHASGNITWRVVRK